MATSEFTHVRSKPDLPAVPFPAVTLQVVLFAALALAALGIRLFALGDAPLNAVEARQALASWHWVNGTPDGFTGSPLLFAGNAVLFTLFGANDGLARLWPALFGALLVLVPALLRRELGRVGALIASALLAFSPSLVLFSRQAVGSVIAVTCALAALVLAWRYLVDRTARPLYGMAVFAALALLASPEVWTVVFAVVLLVVVRLPYVRRLLALEPEGVSDGPARAGQAVSPSAERRRAGILFAAVLVGVATMLLTHLNGIGAVFNQFGIWMTGLRPGGSPLDPLKLLVVYEPIALFFGAIGIGHLFWGMRSGGRDPLPLYVAAVWALFAMALYTIGADKAPERIGAIIVPLALIAGWFLGDWLTQLAAAYAEPDMAAAVKVQEVPVFLLSCALAGFLYLVIAEFSSRGSVLAADVVNAMFGSLQKVAGPGFNGMVLSGLFIIVLAALAFLAVTTLGWLRSLHLAGTVLVLLMVIWTIRQTALVSYAAELNPREWLVDRVMSPSIRDLRNDLLNLSRWRVNDSRTLSVLVDNSLSPIVAWYVRDFRNVRFAADPIMAAGVGALLVPPGTERSEVQLMSQRYTIDSAAREGRPPNLLRWLLFRDQGDVDATSVVLWVTQP